MKTDMKSEFRAYLKLKNTEFSKMYDLPFELCRALKMCSHEGLEFDGSIQQVQLEEITQSIKQNLWGKYSIRQVFVSEKNFWEHLKMQGGGVGRPFASIHGCLASRQHVRWAHAAGLCDGKDMQGRSLFHAASIVETPNVSEFAVLEHMQWKNKQPQWKKETQGAVANFISSVRCARYQSIDVCMSLAALLEKHQAEDLKKEYMLKTGSKTTLRTFGVALWLRASALQPKPERDKWMDWLDSWEEKNGWTEREAWYLTEGFELLSGQLKTVLQRSKSKLERAKLISKHEKPNGSSMGVAL